MSESIMIEDPEFLKELQKEFLDEVTYLLEQCEESYLKLEHPEHRATELSNIFRLAHSMKGAGAAVGFLDLAGFAHKVEDCLSILRVKPDLVDSDIISLLLKCGDAFKTRVGMLKTDPSQHWDSETLAAEVREVTERLGGATINALEAPRIETSISNAPAADDDFFAAAKAPDEQQAPENTSEQKPEQKSGQKSQGSIKVDTDRIDAVMNLVGELVVLKSQLLDESAAYLGNQRLNGITSLIDKTVRELQDRTLSMRMTPLRSLFLRCQRIVRDVSVKLSKPIEFQMSGEDTEIDRTMVELVTDPLLHMIRNSVDHGIEAPEKRQLTGKPEKGVVTISAGMAGGRVLITIQDDGAGIARDKVLSKARNRGLIPESKEDRAFTDSEVFNLLFLPGFSTAEVVSDLSGRGVGLDVVRTNIEKLKGTIDIRSELGKGTTFTISLPLTTSITDGMLVLVNKYPYVLPMDGIRELFDLRKATVTELTHGREVVQVRDKFVPLVPLRKILSSGMEGHSPVTQEHESVGREMAAVVEYCGKLFAFKVDGVLGQSQVVLKALSANLKKTRGVAGAAILGSGQVALVLDMEGLAKESFDGMAA